MKLSLSYPTLRWDGTSSIASVIQGIITAFQRVALVVNDTAYARHTVALGDYIMSDPAITFVLVDKTVGAATLITLPSTTHEGRQVTIKDGKGDAASNNITVAGDDIDGSPTYVMSVNRGANTFLRTGAQWSVL